MVRSNSQINRTTRKYRASVGRNEGDEEKEENKKNKKKKKEEK